MTQQEVNDAVMTLLCNGDVSGLARIVEGVERGEIDVTATASRVVVTVPRQGAVLELVLALRELREEAGDPSLHSIAEEIGVSLTTMSRIFQGEVCSTWPTVKAIVELLGGDPAAYRELWVKARAVRRT